MIGREKMSECDLLCYWKRREDFYALLHALSKHKIIIYSTYNENELEEVDIVLNLSELCLGGTCD